ncbi:hypothetical protein [Blautia massiliensis (ex Durand et al. 2017)]|uniref:hypothetical protein n=1 Tax=Blautia massiliensis (ex Durand et al. 2017) TaxID=1737424 RepID=UPI00242BB7E1|nr:hypothetical protein [Blautia massiliensis (ex Durand et al. 2017)]MDD6547667.1 hypothetical protein [Blautia massiliensis (ex Durand et al. 2017)]
MTLNELKTRLEAEKHFTWPLEIACGEKRETPYILGIYEEDNRWYIYDTDEQGRIVILDNGSEEDMTEAFYKRVLQIEKRILKKQTLKRRIRKKR